MVGNPSKIIIGGGGFSIYIRAVWFPLSAFVEIWVSTSLQALTKSGYLHPSIYFMLIFYMYSMSIFKSFYFYDKFVLWQHLCAPLLQNIGKI